MISDKNYRAAKKEGGGAVAGRVGVSHEVVTDMNQRLINCHVSALPLSGGDGSGLTDCVQL